MLNILYIIAQICQLYSTFMPTLPWMTDLGDQMKEARKGKGWTQQELADKVGLKNRASIIAYESGDGNPEFQVVAKIAAALEKEFNVLGCTIGPKDVIRRLPPAEQLCLEFDHDHIFLAQLTIRPSKKSVLVTAEAQLSDKLA
jgi:transcriptional regulator with XRE-family HTH domain